MAVGEGSTEEGEEFQSGLRFHLLQKGFGKCVENCVT